MWTICELLAKSKVGGYDCTSVSEQLAIIEVATVLQIIFEQPAMSEVATVGLLRTNFEFFGKNSHICSIEV